MIQTRDGALYQGIYSAVAFVLGCGLFFWVSFFGYTLWVIAAAFLIGSLMNLLAYRRHKQAVQKSETALSSAENEQIGIDEVVQDIDLGGKDGVIRLIYASKLVATHRDCIEKIRQSIVGNKEEFSKKYSAFITDNNKKYPKYAKFISELKIQYLIVYRAKGKSQCIAQVHFVGDVGEVWATEYTGESFSELIWL